MSETIVEKNINHKAGADGMGYAELLTMAHSKGLEGVEVEVVQLPTKDNNMMAVCKAKVTMSNHKVFTDIADASPDSVNDVLLNSCLLRVASTRAKSRALRDALGLGVTETTYEVKSGDSTQNIGHATVRQINAIKNLCKQLGRKFDPELMATLNKVAASKLIVQLSEKLQMIS
jgi:hypothetical protein